MVLEQQHDSATEGWMFAYSSATTAFISVSPLKRTLNSQLFRMSFKKRH